MMELRQERAEVGWHGTGRSFTLASQEMITSMHVLEEGESIHMRLAATDRIELYVLDDLNLQKFKASERFHFEGRVIAVAAHRDFRAPTEGLWYLVLYNPRGQTVSGELEVY